MENFYTFKLPKILLQALENMHIKVPTPIQAMSILPALEGKDILASSQTGTGKTLAFLLPILSQLLDRRDRQALVLTPTRELATQVKDTLVKLLDPQMGLFFALLIGGENFGKQCAQLRKNPQLILGTPGRVFDHLGRKTLSLKRLEFFVLDEMDRMLDMGFSEQIDAIARNMPEKRQTFMFSATMPANIIRNAQKYLNNPQRIAVASTTRPVEKIKQDVLHTEPNEKFNFLVKELEQRQGSILVFVKTKIGAEKLAKRLKLSNYDAAAIHGNLEQRKRERVMQSFREQKKRIMVATDIAARGLDVPHIQHVINYDLPQCPEDYIHRIGRTARAGAEGCALSFISSSEKHHWKLIHKFINGDKDKTEKKETSSFRRPSGNYKGRYKGRKNKAFSRFAHN